ncbi:MAG: methylenetetrahydrofolate reductase [Magnetococcales bacterium]|nr:methylenetetrahydrofolate reductase [Magnetococcales bacterium]
MTQPQTAHSTASTTQISIELVPRDEESLKQELELIRQLFPSVGLINIPDLTRFDIRSWTGCAIAKNHFSTTIPHIRAIDIDPDRPLPMKAQLQAHKIGQVLVVTGDPHTDDNVPQYPVNAVDIIKKFKEEMPEIKVYAGIDQYRSGFQKEMHYLLEKEEAGADGFFTQPFFDRRFMEIYGEILKGRKVFWGVSPVISEKSKAYWEKRNNVVFPEAFKPTLEWNRTFAQSALQFAQKTGTDIYFMPIRIDLAHYLQGIL